MVVNAKICLECKSEYGERLIWFDYGLSDDELQRVVDCLSDLYQDIVVIFL